MTDRKYYYLKLKENFFENEEVILLESMIDGHLYSNILLKLYLKSLKSEGRLMFNERIPYNSAMLAQITRHSIGVVEKALAIFEDLGLIEKIDTGAIYISDIQNFIGKSSTEADRKRDYRRRIEEEKEAVKLLSDKCPDKCPTEIDIELDIEIELDTDIDIDSFAQKIGQEEKEVEIIDVEPEEEPEKKIRVPFKKIQDLFNEICISYPKIQGINGDRQRKVRAMYNKHPDIEYFRKLFTLVEESDYLKGNNQYNWDANFDWIMTQSKADKIMEGGYKNKEKKVKEPIPDEEYYKLEGFKRR